MNQIRIRLGEQDLLIDLEAINELLNTHLLRLEGKIMAALDDLKAAVAAEDSVITSAVTLINGFAAQLAAAGTDPDALAALQADVTAHAQALAAAVAANTPTPASAPTVASPAPAAAPAVTDANVAVGSTRFSDGLPQTADSLAAATAANATSTTTVDPTTGAVTS